MKRRERIGDWLRWQIVHLIPTRGLAKALWSAEWIPLGSWGPHVLGRALGQRGNRVEARGLRSAYNKDRDESRSGNGTSWDDLAKLIVERGGWGEENE